MNLLMEKIPVTCVTYLQGHWWRCSNDRKVPGERDFWMIERAVFSCMTWKIHWIYWIYPPVIVARVFFSSGVPQPKNVRLDWHSGWGGDRSKIYSWFIGDTLSTILTVNRWILFMNSMVGRVGIFFVLMKGRTWQSQCIRQGQNSRQPTAQKNSAQAETATKAAFFCPLKSQTTSANFSPKRA